MNFRLSSLARVAPALASALTLAGCGDTGVRSYRIPKDDAGSPPPATSSTTPAAEVSVGAALAWAVPAAWKAKPPSELRKASFDAFGPAGDRADVSVISFPGTGGDDLANVNRWRGQLQLAPVEAGALASQTSILQAPAGQLVVVDLTGTLASDPSPQRMIGAWLRQPGQTWFFKIVGPVSAVAAQKDAFSAFLRSVSASGPAPVAGGLPSGHPALAESPLSSVPIQADRSSASLTWQAPASWRAGPANAMRKGSYLLDAAGSATLAISAFPGDVGGIAANVNRWRGQVGLPPLAEAEAQAATQTITAHGLTFVVADAAAPGGPRILAALVPWQGATWFFKVSGPDEAVGRAKPEFLQFLQSIQAP